MPGVYKVVSESGENITLRITYANKHLKCIVLDLFSSESFWHASLQQQAIDLQFSLQLRYHENVLIEHHEHDTVNWSTLNI